MWNRFIQKLNDWSHSSGIAGLYTFFLMGVLVGILLSSKTFKGFMNTLDKWQTITAGLLAILAAIIGAQALTGSTRQQLKQARRFRYSELRRNLLPQIKTAINYAIDSKFYYSELVNEADGELIESLRQSETSTRTNINQAREELDGHIGPNIARAIFHLQFLNARQLRINKYGRALDAIDIRHAKGLADTIAIWGREIEQGAEPLDLLSSSVNWNWRKDA